MRLEYLDFDLQIAEGEGRDYPIQVLQSPAGEAHATMRFPYDELALENRLLTLRNALLRSGGTRRSVLSAEQKNVQDFGQALFEALIAGEVRSRYDVSLERARQAGKGLRVRLRFQSASLATLPWEFLYDPRQAEFVALTVNTPIVRYLDLPRSAQTLTVAPPLRILGVAASPRDLPTLNVENEKQRVDLALKGLQNEGRIELTWLTEPTWRGLQRTLRREAWHVLHFIGHGGFESISAEGVIYLTDEEGKAQPLRATELGRLLADHASMRLVVLNACDSAKGSEQDIFSSTASILVRRGLPAVVAMQYEITDRAAVELSRAFYEAMADGLPVDAAVASARVSVSLAVNNSFEWGTPVLYMRAPDGILFAMKTTQEPQEPPGDVAPSTQETVPLGVKAQALDQVTVRGPEPGSVSPQQAVAPVIASTAPPVKSGRSWRVLIALAAVAIAVVATVFLWPKAQAPQTTVTATPAPPDRTPAVAAAAPRGEPSDTPEPTATVGAAAISTPTGTRAPAPTLTSVPPQRLTPAVVVNGSGVVNVRSGPGTVYPAIGQTRGGTSLEVLARNAAGDWWQICCVAGQAGWISAGLVTPQGDLGDVAVASVIPTPRPSATAVPQPTRAATTPAGRAIVGVRVANPQGNLEVFVDYSDGASVNVTNNPAADAYASLTPDKRRIVFSSTRNGPANIFVMNVDGSGVTRLAEGNLPALSPDGQRIAYQNCEGGNIEGGICVINLDGSGKIKVSPAGFGPRWSVDGARVIFERLDGTYVVNADGTGEERYTP